MLAAVRAFVKSWPAKILIGLIIVSFGFFGARDVFRNRSASDAVVKAGERKITSQDFRRDFDNFKKNAQQQTGQPITNEIAAENGLDRRVLEQLATQEGLLALLHKIGVRASDALIARELQKVPAFFDPVSGRFDKMLYAQRLRENELTTTAYERIVSDQIAQSHVGSALDAGLVVPRSYTALAAIYGMESRDIGYFAIAPNVVPAVAPPTDAQLEQFIKENRTQLMRPEFRVLSLVRFSPTLVTVDKPIDEADLKKRYDFRKDTLAKPETRSLVQIPAKDAAAAAQIVARLGKGEAPDAIARSLGVDAITYDDKPQSGIADRNVARAAFALAAGQVSGPIKGDLGLAVVKVTKVTPGANPTLEQLRPQLEAEIRKDAALEKVDEMTQAYDDAHAKGANLAEAARKAGAALVTLPPLSRGGQTPDGQRLQGFPPKVLETAFDLPTGGESEIQDLGQGEYFAVRVEKIIPPAVPPLAEIRPELVRFWMGRELARRLQARAEALAEQVRKGATLESAASTVGGRVTRAVGLSRMTVGQNPAIPRDLAAKAFAAKPGEVFVAESEGALMVAKLEGVRATPTPDMIRMGEAARPQMSKSIVREMLDDASKYARTEMKVKTNYALARQALGLEPEVEPAAKKGKSK
jgi:peptidyl-prolyl cis-trans isomerase D